MKEFAAGADNDKSRQALFKTHTNDINSLNLKYHTFIYITVMFSFRQFRSTEFFKLEKNAWPEAAEEEFRC